MSHPLRSLREGNWFKLICGASLQHLPAVRNLTLAYTLAGADCIDVAADPAVVVAAREALQVADDLAEAARLRGFRSKGPPWLMVSLNDGEDPHFRKAEFNPAACPADCSRPCERICPAQAILFDRSDGGFSGVVESRCYGCGRCLPVCPIQQISTRSYMSTPTAIAPLLLAEIDAIEIHTQVGRVKDFERLWQAIAPFVHHLKLIAISCPDGEGLIEYLQTLYHLIAPLPCPLIWQTDGRPMSGDIGDGATRAAVKLSQKVLAAGLPGYVQLAGGTNNSTVTKLRALGLLGKQGQLSPRSVAGVAYGSYARMLLSSVLEQLQSIQEEEGSQSARAQDNQKHRVEQWREREQLPPPDFSVSPSHSLSCFSNSQPSVCLEEVPDLLWQAVDLADSLVSQLKNPMKLKQAILK